MRPLGTWVVIGVLALIGLFAARDALRGDEAPASSPAVQRLEKQRNPASAIARPPQIADKDRLAAELHALGAGGVLYLTDANCRRYLLGLPALVWTTAQGLPGPDCTRGVRPVVSERSGLAAEQVGAETIEVRAEDWRLRFRGNGAAFTPAGMLTFLRDGRLYAWTVRCPHGVARTTFRGLRTLERCPRRVPGAPSGLRELAWLGENDFAAVAGQELASSLLVVRNGRALTLFRSLGLRWERSRRVRRAVMSPCGSARISSSSTPSGGGPWRSLPAPTGRLGRLPGRPTGVMRRRRAYARPTSISLESPLRR